MFVSFAQNREDVMLWRALKDVELGFYIDIGAAWPQFHSVTKAFYDRGWSGINIEPNPALLSQLNQHRVRDRNLGVAIGDAPGVVTINIMSNEGLSTVVDSIAEEHLAKGFQSSGVLVPMATLESICSDYVPPGQDIHFLKIDVEGLEDAVLRGGDWTRFRPWVVVIEAMEPMVQVESHAEWEIFILDAGYKFVYMDGLNRFYVANERDNLVSRFKYPPNVFDEFMTVDMQSALLSAAELQQRAELERRRAAELEDRLELERQRADRLSELEAVLDAERQQKSELESQLFAAHQASEELSGQLQIARRMAEQLDGLQSYLRQKGWVERCLFRWDGRPHRLVQRLLFHTDGRCRMLSKSIVLDDKGQPRRPFQRWLTSEAYQTLPNALKLD